MTNRELSLKRQQIGTALIIYRNKKKLSKLLLSKLTGMDRHTIDNIEQGKTYTIDSLIKYKKAVRSYK